MNLSEVKKFFSMVLILSLGACATTDSNKNQMLLTQGTMPKLKNPVAVKTALAQSRKYAHAAKKTGRAPASTTQFSVGTLSLAQGKFVTVGTATLNMQGDGNLVMYKNGYPLWNSQTSGHNCGTNSCSAVFQGDGNFVVYDGSTALWNSGTEGHPEAQLSLSDTPPYVEVSYSGGSYEKTTYVVGDFTLPQGASAAVGTATLTMQGDGNLVMYQNGYPLWNSQTSGHNCGTSSCYAVLQTDGNFVVYDGSVALWNSGTEGHPEAQLILSASPPYVEVAYSGGTYEYNVFGVSDFTLSQGKSVAVGTAYLAMQADGNLVMYQNGQALWNTQTGGHNCGANSCFAAFQSDGNFVVYDGNIALWNSGTEGHPEAILTLFSYAPYIEIAYNGGTFLATGSYSTSSSPSGVYGCTDPNANNYNSAATVNDGSCTYTVLGCTDPSANNYNPNANTDDGSCTYTSCSQVWVPDEVWVDTGDTCDAYDDDGNCTDYEDTGYYEDDGSYQTQCTN